VIEIIGFTAAFLTTAACASSRVEDLILGFAQNVRINQRAQYVGKEKRK